MSAETGTVVVKGVLLVFGVCLAAIGLWAMTYRGPQPVERTMSKMAFIVLILAGWLMGLAIRL